MHSPDGLYEWLALAGAAVAVVCLVLLVWNALALRRVRRAQRVLLAGTERDVITHAEQLQREFVALRDWVDDASFTLDQRMSRLETGLDGAVTHTAMVRYDAFGAKSGKQSSSVALLNEHRTGVVLTAIVSRNFSHLYVKNLTEGASDIELSPEERHAVELAFATPGQAPVPPAPPAPPRVVSNAPTKPPEPPGEQPQVQAVRQANVER
ncbi:MAG: DUF4446 family protein [Thermoleophilaceae bacterium]|nr:DUF4446 family protein [Thermoleophilaceae bacterium]